MMDDTAQPLAGCALEFDSLSLHGAPLDFVVATGCNSWRTGTIDEGIE
jgi:hypothetical protein